MTLKIHTSFRRLFWLLPVVLTLGLLFSCSDDDDDYDPDFPTPSLSTRPVTTDQSNTVLINDRTIEVGQGEGSDVVFEMSSTIMNENGRVVETTLNCSGMAGVALNGMATDSTRTVENVTLINRGTINVHTKKIVEAYGPLINTLSDKTKKYVYLRVLVMYGGKNSMIINEGTINVYFDHDPSSRITVYAMALSGGPGSSLINRGEIHFYGNGSVATRLRGMATFGDNISAWNTGTMTAEVDMTEDARMITTGGNNSNVINDGVMRMKLPGKVLCCTRYGNSNLINNGTIEVTSVDMPRGYATIVTEEDRFVCGLYEPLQGSRAQMPSMINRGTITINMEGTAQSDPLRQGYGILCDLMGAGAEKLEVNLENDGHVYVNNLTSVPFLLGEAGFMGRSLSQTGACNIHLVRWNTTLRDFARTKDLFVAKGVKMNYAGGKLTLGKADNYVPGTPYSIAPEALVYNAGAEAGFRFEYSNYDNLTVKAASLDYTLVWDKEARTAALQ